MVTISKGALGSFLAVGIILGLTACGLVDPLDSMTLAEAKKIALSTEDEIASVVPEKFVAKHEQRQTGHLLSCSAGGYNWPGQTVLSLQGDPDVQAILDKIEDHMKKAGYQIRVRTTSGGQPRVQALASDGGNYYAESWYFGTELRIHSYSPCFKLPEGEYPGAEY